MRNGTKRRKGEFAPILDTFRSVGVTLKRVPGERAFYTDGANLYLLMRYSRKHFKGKRAVFFFGINRPKFERYSRDGSLFVVFVCGSYHQSIVVPSAALGGVLRGVDVHTFDEWKINIYQFDDRFEIKVTGKPSQDLTQFLNEFNEAIKAARRVVPLAPGTISSRRMRKAARASAREKQTAFWPLPGGARNYNTTLMRILGHVRESHPSPAELSDWLRREYDLTGVKAPAGYLRLPRMLGFMRKEKGRVLLTAAGEKLLDSRDPGVVLSSVVEKVAGVDDIFLFLLENPSSSMKEIHEAINRYGWKKRYQTYYRLCWLLSLGYVEETLERYLLTEKGLVFARTLKVERRPPTAREELTHSDLEDKMKEVGEFFEFDAFKRVSVNRLLPPERQLRRTDKQLDGLWVRKVPFGGELYYAIEVQIGGNISDTIDRLETVSDVIQRALVVTDPGQKENMEERLRAKRSKLIDKVVFVTPREVDKLTEAKSVLKALTDRVFGERGTVAG